MAKSASLRNLMVARQQAIDEQNATLGGNDPAGGVGKALDAESYRKQFIEAMDDDFNTARAVATLFDLARVINQAADSGISFQAAKNLLLSLAQEVLGLKLPEQRIIYLKGSFKISGKLT